jgi:hypothetical protein
MDTLICKVCKKEFPLKMQGKRQQIYCSKNCYLKFISEERILKNTFHCNLCGKTFIAHQIRENRNKFCSLECSRKSQTININCKNCNKVIRKWKFNSNNVKYCNYDCYLEYVKKSGVRLGSNSPSYRHGLYKNKGYQFARKLFKGVGINIKVLPVDIITCAVQLSKTRRELEYGCK